MEWTAVEGLTQGSFTTAGAVRQMEAGVVQARSSNGCGKLEDMDRVYLEDETISTPDAAAALPST